MMGNRYGEMNWEKKDCDYKTSVSRFITLEMLQNQLVFLLNLSEGGKKNQHIQCFRCATEIKIIEA